MFLDPSEDLYQEIGHEYLRIMFDLLKDVYVPNKNGNVFLWSDQYNELDPPYQEPKKLENSAKRHFDSMSSLPFFLMENRQLNVIWVLQGWLFVMDKHFWKPNRIEAYLSGAPKDNLLMLDLIAENQIVAMSTKEFYNHNWIWCFLNNFGGSNGMNGNLRNIFNIYHDKLKSNFQNLIGVGLSMEGIEENFILYKAVMSLSYSSNVQSAEQHLDNYLTNFILARYAFFSSFVSRKLNFETHFYKMRSEIHCFEGEKKCIRVTTLVD